MSEIYQPAEDSYFLSDVLKKKINIKKIKKALDMGSGSGIQGKTIIDLGIKPKNVTLVDINPIAIKNLKKNFPLSKVTQSNLFEKIKDKFDIIIFNPPYLPEDKYDKEKDTTGGKNGSEIINKFLFQAKKYFNKEGKIILLTSNLTKKIDFSGYNKKLIGRKKLFFEELYIWELTP